MKSVFEDVTCAGCGCVCDDIQVTTDGQQILNVQTSCPQGQAWFARSQKTEQLQPLIKGVDVSREAAISRIAGLIQEAQAPLIYGMGQSSTDAQRAAVSLADRVGATIDSGVAASTRALQQVGEASCTLGEVRSRADLIVYWDAETLRLNQKHQESLAAQGAPPVRKIVTLGADLSTVQEQVDFAITVPEETEIDLVWRLRAVLKGLDLAGAGPTGFASEEVQQLVDLIQQSHYVVFFLGTCWKQGKLAHRKLETLSLLVREIQAERRCHSLNVPAPGQTKGAEPVLAWQTGYAAAVNFAAGYPRYEPCAYAATQMLEQGETDLCLLIGENPLSGLSEEALKQLGQMTLIHIGPCPLTDVEPEVFFPTGISGVHFAGSLYRFDGTPLPLRSLIPTSQFSEADVLTQVEQLLEPVLHTCWTDLS